MEHRVLVTGLHGFTGRHLQPALVALGFEVHGIVAPQAASAGADIGTCVHVADVLDPKGLADVVARVQPRYVVHLAAISFVAHGDADAMYRVNIVGTRNLLQALAAEVRPECVLLASSANIYGNAAVDPIDESTPPLPANDYAVSKLAMEHMASLWQDKLPITLVRPFNYTGRGQESSFLIPKIVQAFRRRDATLELGNLDVERDFSDVRDVAQAYAALLRAVPGGVVNVCSGRVHSLTDVLEVAHSLTGFRPEIRVNPRFVRANEVRRLRGDNTHLRSLVPGWRARPLTETLSWMLNDDAGADLRAATGGQPAS